MSANETLQLRTDELYDTNTIETSWRNTKKKHKKNTKNDKQKSASMAKEDNLGAPRPHLTTMIPYLDWLYSAQWRNVI